MYTCFCKISWLIKVHRLRKQELEVQSSLNTLSGGWSILKPPKSHISINVIFLQAKVQPWKKNSLSEKYRLILSWDWVKTGQFSVWNLQLRQLHHGSFVCLFRIIIDTSDNFMHIPCLCVQITGKDIVCCTVHFTSLSLYWDILLSLTYTKKTFCLVGLLMLVMFLWLSRLKKQVKATV